MGRPKGIIPWNKGLKLPWQPHPWKHRRYCLRGHDTQISGRQSTTSRCKECSRESDRLRRTGCTPRMYATLYIAQEGRCLGCKQVYQNLVADHDHKTQQIRGLLCSNCNLALGNAKDSSEILRTLANYLDSKGQKCIQKNLNVNSNS